MTERDLTEDFEDPDFCGDLDEGEQDQETGGLYEHFRLVVDRKQTPLRADKYIFDHLVGQSRNRIQKAADAGFVMANGKPIKSNYKVKGGDILTIMMDRPPFDNDIVPEDIPINVVYEDRDVIVVNKPAGMCVHPGCGNYHGTLVHAIAWHLKEDATYNPNDPEVGLVHRIDKDTSGLLVIAKTPLAKTSLGMQFFNKTTQREYNALVWGNLKEDKGTVRANIARDPKSRMLMTVFPDGSETGKRAVTHYEVLERFAYVTLVKCVLETGRTHQIRCHMKSIGHVLFNDERYGGNEILKGNPSSSYRQFVMNCFDTCPRQALHARTLGFEHPRTKERMFFTSELPEDMTGLIEKWRTYVSGAKGI